MGLKRDGELNSLEFNSTLQRTRSRFLAMLGGLDTIKGGGDGSYWDRTIEVLSASYGPTTRTILRKEGYI